MKFTFQIPRKKFQLTIKCLSKFPIIVILLLSNLIIEVQGGDQTSSLCAHVNQNRYQDSREIKQTSKQT